jgi:hypothetical protein
MDAGGIQMTESAINELLRRIKQGTSFIDLSLQNHIPVKSEELLLQTNGDLAKLIEHVQQLPQPEIYRLLQKEDQ